MTKSTANPDPGGGTDSLPREEVQWHLARDGRQYGPLSPAEIAKLVELGHLKDGDLVWRAGFQDWRELSDVRHEIVPAAAPARPQPSTEPIGDTASIGASDRTNAPQQSNIAAVHHTGSTQPNWQKRLQALADRDFGMPQGGGAPDGSTSGATSAVMASEQPDAMARREARGNEPRRFDAREPYPRTSDPRMGDPRMGDPGLVDPRLVDPRLADPRLADPRLADPRLADPRLADPRLAGSMSGNSRQLDGVALGPHAPHGQPTAGPMAHERRPSSEMRGRPTPQYGADDESEFDERPRRSLLAKVAVSLILLAVLGAGTGYAYMNRTMLLEMFEQVTGGGEATGAGKAASKRTNDIQHGRAAPAETTTASPVDDRPPAQPVTLPPTAAPTTPGGSETAASGLMATPLWTRITAQFPEWAATQRDEMEKLRAQRVPSDTIDGRLMEAIIDLRRKNANDALAAPEDHVIAVAGAFLNNLKVLKARSTDACYGFISRGETSPAVLPLIGRDGGVTEPVLAQLDAVMVAIGAGKKEPVAYVQPFASDYTALTDELVKRGWSRKDLELFSNPQALSKATADEVCRLVTGWFEAQLGIPKREVQMRLLRQSLRPVVSG